MTRLIVVLLALLAPSAHAADAIATFASGCFWCSESDFEKVQGVKSVISGYTGGAVDTPGYEEVSAGGTGHTEAVEVRYDPTVVSYAHLLDVYWNSADPYTPNASFCDHGSQYRTAIFYHDAAQKAAAERTRDALAKKYPTRGPIVVQIAPASRFWPAEDYHQDYATRNSVRYRYYRWGCGRDQRLDELWGKERIRK